MYYLLQFTGKSGVRRSKSYARRQVFYNLLHTLIVVRVFHAAVMLSTATYYSSDIMYRRCLL